MKRDRRSAAGAALAALAALPGCINLTFSREHIDEPVPVAVLESLVEGNDDLGTCLQRLGAPYDVFEYRDQGMALLWVWRDKDGFGLELSSPIENTSNVSFTLDLSDASLPGCVLWFSPDLQLERWRAGSVGDLLPGRLRRPSVPEADR